MQDYSAILLFDQSPQSRTIELLQKDVAATFGGTSVLRLPPHVTLWRWASDSQKLNDDILSFHQAPASFYIPITGIEVSDDEESIWYTIEMTSDVCRLQEGIRHAVELSGAVSKRVKEAANLHITVAYRDYAPEAIRKIRAWLTETGRPEKLLVAADHTALCERGDDGEWNLCKPSTAAPGNGR